jgi:chaperonin GroES|tara:strand:+ start:415 stop:690 length:276 start_codon:yes stop_codon:yes gene_type:complete
MARKVIPVGNKLLLKKTKQATKTAGGIIIPEIAQKKEYKGTVVGVGAEVKEIKVGDIVQYADYAMPTPMEHEGEEHLLVQAGDVFAIIRDE